MTVSFRSLCCFTSTFFMYYLFMYCRWFQLNTILFECYSFYSILFRFRLSNIQIVHMQIYWSFFFYTYFDFIVNTLFFELLIFKYITQQNTEAFLKHAHCIFSQYSVYLIYSLCSFLQTTATSSEAGLSKKLFF